MSTAQSFPSLNRPPEAGALGPAAMSFGLPGRELFGFYHPPTGDTSCDLAVVLCNPLGYEAMCSHRAYRHLADRLASEGIAALRFDYQGTGDSSGAPEEPKRLAAWRESIGYAIDALKERAGVKKVALVGTRFGALLAADVARERNDVDALVLWAIPLSGKAYVRELRAFRLIKEQEGTPARLDGDEEVAGYLFDRATVSDMSALDVVKHMGHFAQRALVLPRETAAGEDRIVKHLTACGTTVRCLDESGYGAMMRDAQDTVVPKATLDDVARWLASGASQRATPDVARAAVGPTALTVFAPDGKEVREEAVQFGPGERLFGILAESTAPAATKPTTAILYLNVGANHRVGPNRMYVALSRELAPRGYPSFRFDVAGLGDSRIAPGAAENRLYSKDSVGDVKAAMDYLERARDIHRFVLVGLCSGAYLAFHTTVEDTRVVGQVLLNPQTFEWKEGDSLELSIRKSFMSTRFYMRAIFDPKVWVRVARGKVNVRGIAGALRERLENQARSSVESFTAKVRGEREPQGEIEKAFYAMSDRGVESLLVFSFNDGGLDMIQKHLGRNVRRMKGRKNFHFEVVDGADHTFTPIDSQHRLHRILAGHIRSRHS